MQNPEVCFSVRADVTVWDFVLVQNCYTTGPSVLPIGCSCSTVYGFPIFCVFYLPPGLSNADYI